jgi:hypothetical protein
VDQFTDPFGNDGGPEDPAAPGVAQQGVADRR